LDSVLNPVQIGILLLVLSAVIWSSAGLFAKGVAATAWDIIFWRSLFAGLLTSGFVVCRSRFVEEFVAMHRSGWAVAIVRAAGTAAFIPAFKHTSIANVSLIYAISPLVAGVMAWIWIGESMSRAVIAGSVAAMSGVMIIVWGSLGSFSLTGDLLALAMVIAMSLVMVIYRRYPHTPAAGPNAMSCLLLMPLGWIFGSPLSNPPFEIILIACFGLVFALASVLLAEGARRVPAGQTALLSTLEAPLAPVLAWLVLSELPSMATVLGGSIILIAVVASQNVKTAA